ncbi:MAG: EamA family transporter [Chitinophagales bacterium]|nr:EamA family transporter [Chitinophagales bacterium]MDW8273978.1 EamA family transporter [Chitinophagales bacterium]
MALDWLAYALLAMLFAGLTSVLAKFGLQHINSDLGVAIRTATLFGIITLHLIAVKGYKDLPLLDAKSVLFLCLSGCTTALSWIFYYRAIKTGNVSYVATIDKGSILITILLSVVFLREPLTPKLLIGAFLIITGLLILVWK